MSMKHHDAPPAACPEDLDAPSLTVTDPGASSDLSLVDDDTAEYRPPDYNPDDYRWVPVRRRPRYDGWTEEKQRRFIEALADTGIVTHAAKTVGMTRESANRLRRSPHGAAFARAWDAARLHAGSALEDIAFERAIEGAEHHIYDEYGEVVCTRRVYSDRLLTFLLRHLKPERYGPAAAFPAEPATPPPAALDECLRAMEPQLPAPPEELLDAGEFGDGLWMADTMDGVGLPHFLTEQRPVKSAARIKAEAEAAQDKRGAAAWEKLSNKPLNETCNLTKEEMTDMCHYLDPTLRHQRRRACFK